MNTPSERRQRTSEPGLARDTRGAVTVVAVFMAAFLVGALWYIIGIGDTILYRERMQDGADATAYAGAVYHARGMNIIAMINVIMAGILAVLVAMKLVQVMNFIANVISCAIAAACAIGVGCWAVPICTYTTQLQNPIQRAISAYERFVKATLPALSKAQVGVAAAMPWMAEGKAVYVSSQYYSEPVQGGGILSTSLVPFVPKERLGLPVQEDKYSNLCKKAGEYVAEVVFQPFPFAGWMKGVIGGIVSTFPGYFCAGGGAMGADFNQAAVDQICASKKKKHDKENEGKRHPPKFDMKKCKKDTKKDGQKDINEKVGGLGGAAGSLDATKMTPKKVFHLAENGNDYFQVWSVVVGDDYWPKEDEEGVAIAAWDQNATEIPSIPWGKIAVAQAEFYYDTSGAWDDYKDDAMWNMRWRARMRRVRPPVNMAAGILGDVIGGKLLSKLDGKIKDVFANSEFIDFVIGSSAGKKFQQQMRKVIAGGSKWADDEIENEALKNFDQLEIIH